MTMITNFYQSLCFVPSKILKDDLEELKKEMSTQYNKISTLNTQHQKILLFTKVSSICPTII